MSRQSLPLIATPAPATARTARRVAVVSLPFYTQYASCLPALLVREIAEAAGDTADLFLSHIEFALSYIRDQSDHDSYKRLTHEAHIADLALLPSLRGWHEADMRAQTEIFAASVRAPSRAVRERLGAAMDDHLEQLAERLGGYDIVAITATHYQLVPSLLLAERLAERYGDGRPRVVLGGYFASEQVAKQLLDVHQDLDLVVYGEAEDIWETIVACLSQRDRKVVRGAARTFRNHFARQDDVLAAVGSIPWLAKRFQATLELSRGCYWDKCDFCNFNAAYDVVFKAHRPERVLGEMDRLADTFGQRRFQFTDTAVPRLFTRYLDTAGVRRHWDVFLELRPDFEYDEYAALLRLGTVRVQLGIESLVESHLARMGKNATVGDNVRSLLMCQSAGIRPTWGILVGHPDERLEELVQTLERTRAWRHLPPPKYVSACELRANSELEERRDLRLQQARYPCPAYALVLPLDQANADFVPVRAEEPDVPPMHAAVIAAIEESILEWQSDYERGARLSGSIHADGSVRIRDTRVAGSAEVHEIAGLPAEVLLSVINGGKSADEIARTAGVPERDVTDSCDELAERGLALWSVRRRSGQRVLESLVGGLFGQSMPERAAPDRLAR
jgi:Radical SAM superfamily